MDWKCGWYRGIRISSLVLVITLGIFYSKMFSMIRQWGACTPIWLVIRELNPYEHKSFTNEVSGAICECGWQLREYEVRSSWILLMTKYGGEQ